MVRPRWQLSCALGLSLVDLPCVRTTVVELLTVIGCSERLSSTSVFPRGHEAGLRQGTCERHPLPNYHRYPPSSLSQINYLFSLMSPTHPTAASPSNFQLIFNNALKTYERRTKNNLFAHPLAAQLQACDSPSSIFAVLQEQVQELDQARSGDERWTKWIDPTVNVLFAFSATIGAGVGMVCPRTCSHPRSAPHIYLEGTHTCKRNFLRNWRTPFGLYLQYFGVGHYNTYISQVAKDVRASQDTLADIFERIGMFFRRLEMYTEVPLTTEMIDITIQIMVEVLFILGVATKEINQGRTSE